jgi:hypothetical protein
MNYKVIYNNFRHALRKNDHTAFGKVLVLFAEDDSPRRIAPRAIKTRSQAGSP